MPEQGFSLFSFSTMSYTGTMPKPHKPDAQQLSKWLDELIAPDSKRKAAKALGISPSTLTRQIHDVQELAPDLVIRLCRIYGRSPAQGLYETGHLSVEELHTPNPAGALPKIDTLSLLKELEARVEGDIITSPTPTGSNSFLNLLTNPASDLYNPNIDPNDPFRDIFGDTFDNSTSQETQARGDNVEHLNDRRRHTVRFNDYGNEYDETRHVALNGDELEPNELQEP